MDPTDAAALAQEVANSNFADERLNKRLKALIAGLGADPTQSLPRAFDSAGLEAAYRFFGNHRVTPEDILAPHIEATKARCATQGTFLVLHDTTAFTYRYDGEREGLARIRRSENGSRQAFFAHLSLAVAADGTRRPLGVAALKHWTRNAAVKGVEFQRWEDQVRESSAQLDGLKDAIHVMDREADDYQMFSAFLRDGHRFVARCMSDRRLATSTGKTKLRELLATIPTTVEREIPLQRRKQHRNPILKKIHPARETRTTKLSVAATTVLLKRPSTNSKRHLALPPTLPINIVRIWEATPPEGETAVEWYLYTSEPIETPEQQLAVVDYYRARWTIEEYFKALKTGCDFESRQLQDYEGLVNLLATFAPIAYRMLLLRSEARRTPDESAVSVLTPDHIAVLRAKGRTKLSANPTTREVYLAVAVLGGHIKYSKRDPGWLTLARGLEDLEKLTEGYRIGKLQAHSDQP
jgi:hypothetical protein